MDIQDLVPVGGGSLRGRPVPEAAPVATFTQTQTVHPDEIWHPLGGTLDLGRAPSRSPSAQDQGQTRQQGDAGPGRPGTDTGDGFDLGTTARMIRSALRGGS